MERELSTNLTVAIFVRLFLNFKQLIRYLFHCIFGVGVDCGHHYTVYQFQSSVNACVLSIKLLQCFLDYFKFVRLPWTTFVIAHLDLAEEPAQMLLTSYELVEMSALFNVSESVVFSVIRDILVGDEWIEQPHIVGVLQTPLLRLCARYLYVEKKRGYAINPVGESPLNIYT